MAEDINLRINLEGADDAINQAASLRSQLKEVTQQLQSMEVGSDEFSKLSEKAGELKDRINDVNAAIADSSGEPIENVSKSFGSLGGNIKALDFKAVDQGFKTLAGNVGKIKFSTLTDGIKSVGNGFLQLGKALLANPIFLIAAIIIGIGAALYALKDKIKPIADLFAWLGDIIGGVVQFFKDLGDELGLTSFALEEAAEKANTAAKETSDNLDKETSRRIKLMQAQGASIEQLSQVERDAAVQKALLTQNAIAEYDKLAAENGKLTEEQQKEYDQRVEDLKNYQNEIMVIDAKAAKDALDAQKKADQDKIDAEAAAYKKRVDAAKKFNQDRINASRAIANLEIQNIQDDNARARAALDQKYKQDIEDINRNENLLKDERIRLKAATDEAYNQAVADQNQKELDENQAQWDAEIAQMNAAIEAENEILTKQLEEKAAAEKEASDRAIQLAKDEKEAKDNLLNAQIGAIAAASELIKAVGGKNKAAAIAAFTIDKAIAAANVIIQGIRERAALSATYALLGPAGIAPGIVARNVSRINTALSLAAIAATAIKGVGGGAAGGSASSTDGGGGSGGGAAGGLTAPPPPQLNTSSNAFTLPPNSNPNGNSNNQNTNVNATVSVVEINNVQRRVNVIQQNSVH